MKNKHNDRSKSSSKLRDKDQKSSLKSKVSTAWENLDQKLSERLDHLDQKLGRDKSGNSRDSHKGRK